MKRRWLYAFSTLLAFSALNTASLVQAEINVNVNVNTPEQNKLFQNYAKLFSYQPVEVEPLRIAPPMEVPTILQVAKSAAVLPAVIWEFRKAGYSYADILKHYTLPQTALFNPQVSYDKLGLTEVSDYHRQYGNQWPQTVTLADPQVIQLGNIRFLTHYVHVAPTQLIKIPTSPVHLTQVILNPRQSSEFFVLKPIQVELPLGQAKKVGFLPPGQAKKIGLWVPPGQAKKLFKEGVKDQEKGHGRHDEDRGRGHGRHDEGHGGGHGHGKHH